MFNRRDPIKDGLEIYKTGLKVVLRDGQIDTNELQQLNVVAAKYGLQDHHTRPLRAQAFEQQCATRLADAVLTDQEMDELRTLIRMLGLTVADVPAAAQAIARARQRPPVVVPQVSQHPTGQTYEEMNERSLLEQVTQALAFYERDWNRAWPLILKGLKLVSSRPAREAYHFYDRAGASLYLHRDVVDGALQKAIEVFEAQLEITPLAVPEDAAWWKTFYEVSRKHYEEMGWHDTRPLPAIPECKHRGLKQLCIIREKRGEITEAIRLCDLALGNDWAGDWLIRRDRLQAKLNKQQGRGTP